MTEDACTVCILEQNAVVCDVPLDGPLELGRQRAGEPGPFHRVPASAAGLGRLIIAPQQDKENISRRHLTLTPLPGGRVRISNHSQAGVALGNASTLATGEAVELEPPFEVVLPGRTVRVTPPLVATVDYGVYHLDERAVGPAAAANLSIGSQSLRDLQPAQMRVLLEGVPRLLGVLQSAVGTADFLEQAGQALVHIVGLDNGRVLLRQGDAWDVAAAHGAARDLPGWRPSRHVLDRLLATRSAVWQKPQRATEPGSASLRLLDTVVAAPLLDRHDAVTGLLYGERRTDSPRAGRADSQVEAMLVNLLAGGVAAGLARLEQEQAALKAAALFEQFFTPELARHLAADKSLLEGREADVSVLFADVRAFSRHSERLGAATAIRWMNDVLDELSRCVRDEGGVLVDYVGDELMAMWGAPAAQPDHATRAARAALAMHAALPTLNESWQATLGEQVMIGVGISSGKAQVGNIGSQIKFKYGPHGHTVNLASRVQGLTKYLRCGVLASAATQRQLAEPFSARRVVKARVVNIDEPVDLFEVDAAGTAERRAFFAESQAALDALEAGNFAHAARLAGQLLLVHGDDGPLLLTLSRAAEALMRGGAGFDPVWVPPGK